MHELSSKLLLLAVQDALSKFVWRRTSSTCSLKNHLWPTSLVQRKENIYRWITSVAPAFLKNSRHLRIKVTWISWSCWICLRKGALFQTLKRHRLAGRFDDFQSQSWTLLEVLWSLPMEGLRRFSFVFFLDMKKDEEKMMKMSLVLSLVLSLWPLWCVW